MSRRTGLGRHRGFGADAGDPLDGLVNLFDIGLVLAVAFLLAGLGLAIDERSGAIVARTSPSAKPVAGRTPLQQPASPAQATGRGQPVGQVYRLPDGRLVLVRPGTTAP